MMAQENSFRKLLIQADPARYYPPERLARLEARILDRAAVTPRLTGTPEGAPLAAVMGASSLSFWRSTVVACMLLMMGVFTGQNLNATVTPSVSSQPSYTVLAFTTPWHSWIVDKEAELK